jgi:hypothetical protein
MSKLVFGLTLTEGPPVKPASTERSVKSPKLAIAAASKKMNVTLTHLWRASRGALPERFDFMCPSLFKRQLYGL